MTGIFDLVVRERELLHDMQPWRGLSNRSHLSEYARVELDLIAEFDRSKSATGSPSTVEIEGFVSRVGGRLFILRPCLSVIHGILCDGSGLKSLPTDYEFVSVKGKRVLPKNKARYALTDCLEVDDLERVRLRNVSLEPEISTRDAEENLLDGYSDLPRQIKTNLLASIISSPGGMIRVGGLTTTLLPIDSSYSEAQYLLLEDLRKSIPRDLTSQYHVTVQTGRGGFTISPFPWNMHTTSNALWNQERDTELFSRVSDGSIQEMTIGFSASSAVPKSLDEIWIRQTDLPMLVDKEVSRQRRAVSFDLDLAKFFITVHTNYPFIDSQVDENLTRLITPRLIKLRRDYDYRGYGGLVNLDISTGNPRSILSIAKTIARSDGSESVTEEHVNQAVTLFADSREDIFEAWSETQRDFGFGRLSYRKEVQKTGKTGERIVTFLIEHPNVTKAEIRAAVSRVQDRIFNQAFNDLLKRNLIYQSDSRDDRYSATYASW